MVNYANGKIYKIVCNKTGLQYFGSTTKKHICQRITAHKDNIKSWKEGKRKSKCTSYVIFENDDYYYELVENYPCESKDQLTAREGFWIRNNECVNKVVPHRTRKEYRQDNKERIAEQKKEYYEQNKETIDEWHKKYREENKERKSDYDKQRYKDNRDKKCEYSKEYYKANKEHINEQRKEYMEANKEKILEKQKEYREANKEKIKENIVCDCGSVFRKDYISKHKKSKKHLAWIDSQN